MYQAKEKYRGVFEIQKSGDKTSSGEIGLDIRTHASPKVGQDQVSGEVSIPCRHATSVADALWKPKNFPGWPTLFRLRWGRPIREVAYTVTYILTSWMIKICMLSTFLNSSDSVAEWLRRLTSDLGVVSSSPARDSFFFLSVIWRNYYFFLIVHYYVLSIAITINT